jgi:hypothetical protein
MNISITHGSSRRLVAHKPDCPVVNMHRTMGLPIMTMFGCQDTTLPGNVRKHSCLPQTQQNCADTKES